MKPGSSGVDSEREDPDKVRERVRNDVTNNLRVYGLTERVEVEIVVVNPKHETWLCIGILCSTDENMRQFNECVRECVQDPEHYIQRVKRRLYRKALLAKYAESININSLIRASELTGNLISFKRYIDTLRWLIEDC